MPITILAGGCRRTTATGQVEEKSCQACPEQNTCDLEPRARELARMISNQWVKSHERPPPTETPILYLEYPSAEPSGTVHCGFYNRRRRKFIEQGSAEAIPKDRVIAWMPIPQVPLEIYEKGRFIQSQRAELGLGREHPGLD